MVDPILKPCPFCGGTDFCESLNGGIWPDHMDDNHPPHDYVVTNDVWCETCGAYIQACSSGEKLGDASPDEARANSYKKWNARVERTCTIKTVPIEMPDDDGLDDMTISFEVCSECGWPDMYTTGKDFNPRPVWFCPRCGAKVVDE